MSRGRQPKIGDEPSRPGGNRGLYTPKETQSHPDVLAESPMHTLSINMGKRDSTPAYLAISDLNGAE
jgi:hypothetical protein